MVRRGGAGGAAVSQQDVAMLKRWAIGVVGPFVFAWPFVLVTESADLYRSSFGIYYVFVGMLVGI